MLPFPGFSILLNPPTVGFQVGYHDLKVIGIVDLVRRITAVADCLDLVAVSFYGHLLDVYLSSDNSYALGRPSDGGVEPAWTVGLKAERLVEDER